LVIGCLGLPQEGGLPVIGEVRFLGVLPQRCGLETPGVIAGDAGAPRGLIVVHWWLLLLNRLGMA